MTTEEAQSTARQRARMRDPLWRAYGAGLDAGLRGLEPFSDRISPAERREYERGYREGCAVARREKLARTEGE